MIISKLEVKGAGKETASIELEPGLNVIAGASDTGKSYITKCFQFIFGTESPPKAIDQAKGYTHLEVTFEAEDGEPFILTRELKEKSAVVCNEVNKGIVTVLKPHHKGTPNLSEFFLSKFGLNNMFLAKGLESMNHSALTLRIFERVLLVDEERIITESSPFGKGQNNEKTLELSLLKTLLTGNDDAEIRNVKTNKSSKDTLKKKIESLQEFLRKFFSNEEESENSIEKLDVTLEQLEKTYDKAEAELNELIQSNKALLQERETIKAKAKMVSRKVSDDTTLLGRFDLLEKKYISDRERLEANTEAAVYIEQQRIVNCPLCGNEIDQDNDVNVVTISEANAAEIYKIDIHLYDLRSTQKSVGEALGANEETLKALMTEISRKDKELGLSIGKKIQENRKILNDLDAVRSDYRKKQDFEKKRQEIYKEIGKLQTEHDDISDIYKLGDFSKEAEKLGKEIAAILTRWAFPNGAETNFDIDARDITISGKPRSHFGKGYRAICFSAILLGVMEFLYPKGRHPGFTILDSPLTTYKKQDESVEAENKEVFLANNLIYAFYRDLCDYYTDKQIIILDNQVPDDDLQPSMNYIHFSGNKDVDRYGFFPIS